MFLPSIQQPEQGALNQIAERGASGDFVSPMFELGCGDLLVNSAFSSRRRRSRRMLPIDVTERLQLTSKDVDEIDAPAAIHLLSKSQGIKNICKKA